MKIILTTLNAKYMHTSLGLRYLKRFCGTDYDIELKEFTINNSVLDVLGQLLEAKPAVIGFLCYIWNIEQTRQLIEMVRAVRPDCVIVCGGPEVAYETVSFMQECSAVDYVIRGEGEVLFKNLLAYLNGAQHELDDRIARRFADGRIDEGKAVVVTELEQIIFPYTVAELGEIKEKIIYYESSRGCPFSCQYCLSCATRGVRYLSIERVLNELKMFIEAGVRQVKFVDRTFNADKRHYMPIWRFIALQNCRTNFHFEIAAELLDDEAIQLLQSMPQGRIQLEIGIQSTYEPTLRAVQRKNDWLKLQTVIPKIVGFGNMHVHVDLIIGLPYENMLRFGKSFNDVYSLRADMLQVGFLKMLKGSGLANTIEEHGYIFMAKAPYQVLATKYLSYEEIWQLHIFEDVVEQFYNSGRFRNTTDYLIKLRQGDAFAFYMALTDYWRERGLNLAAHTPKTLYAILYNYARESYSIQEAENVRELLKLDAMLVDQGKIKASELNWNEGFYHDETSAFLGEGKAALYIDGYKFTNWREVRRQYHIEVLEIDVVAWLQDGRMAAGRQPVLFFTSKAGKYKIIEAADFWLAGGQK